MKPTLYLYKNNKKAWGKPLGEGGFTLLEALIAGGLMGVVAIGAAEILTATSRHASESKSRQNYENGLLLFGGTLQKTLATGSIRLFGFTGSPPGAQAPHPLSRLIMPQPGVCQDLTSPCPDQTAIAFASYEKSLNASVSTFCVLNPSAPGGDYVVLVDGYDKTYGDVTFNGALPSPGFDIDLATVKSHLGITADHALALFAAPVGTAWIAREVPTLWPATQDPTTFAISGDGNTLSSDCAARLQDSGMPNLKKIDRIYQIKVKPWVLTQFTGYAAAHPDDLTAAISSLPMRVFGMSMRSIGASRLPAPQATKFKLGYAECTFASNASIQCDADPTLEISPIDRVRVDEIFSTALFDSTSTASLATRFELISPVMTLSSACAAPDCQPLNVQYNTVIRGLFNTSETLDHLDVSGFSTIKQDALQTLRIRVLIDAAKNREEQINVQIR